MVPLPNPGEGGPLPPFPENNGNTPMIPLPNPGEADLLWRQYQQQRRNFGLHYHCYPAPHYPLLLLQFHPVRNSPVFKCSLWLQSIFNLYRKSTGSQFPGKCRDQPDGESLLEEIPLRFPGKTVCVHPEIYYGPLRSGHDSCHL